MSRNVGFAIAVALLSLIGMAFGVSAERLTGSDQGGRPFAATLTGEAEVTNAGVPNQGDLDGTGSAVVTLNQGQGVVCFELTTADIAAPTRAHIHRGAAGSNGSIVVDFFNGPPTPGPRSGCVAATKELIKEIRQNPSGFYFNVHNENFPAGAVRGQLG